MTSKESGPMMSNTSLPTVYEWAGSAPAFERRRWMEEGYAP
jgi:hypothetical protein